MKSPARLRRVAAIALCLGLSVAVACNSEPDPDTTPASTETTPTISAPSATPTPLATPTPTPTFTPRPTAIPRPTLSAPEIPELVRLSPQQTGQRLTFDVIPETTPLDIVALARQLLPDADLTPPPVYQDSVGDAREFSVYDLSTNSHFSVTARLCVATENADFYVQEGLDIPCTAFDDATQRYENSVRPTIIDRFAGDPSEANELRITLLHANLPGFGGYFDSGDLEPLALNPHAGGRYTLYLNAAGNRPGNPIHAYYDSLVAHELQHAIHHLSDPNESTWINEGLSVLAEDAVAVIARANYFLTACPPTQVVAWPSTSGAAGCNYAGAGLIMRYLRDNYPDQDGTLRQFVAEPNNGLRGLETYLQTVGADVSAVELLTDWGVANYLDGRSNLNPYPHYEAQARATAAFDENGEISKPFTQFAAEYIELPIEPGIHTIEFQGDTVTSLLPHLDDTSGSFWHAGGEDSAVYSLSKTFDLRSVDVDDATLTLLLRHDTEEDWDFAYATASTDGGETWRVLRSPSMSDSSDIAVGQAFGPGFTGASGDGPLPGWILEKFDLSDFLGQQVLFRLLYLTDQSINLDGVSLGGAWLPAADYGWAAINHPVPASLASITTIDEAGGGWAPGGFFFSNNLVQQDYAVRLMTVSPDGDATITAMQIDEQGRGALTFDNSDGGLAGAAIMIMPMAPQTRQPTQATLTIRPAEDAE